MKSNRMFDISLMLSFLTKLQEIRSDKSNNYTKSGLEKEFKSLYSTYCDKKYNSISRFDYQVINLFLEAYSNINKLRSLNNQHKKDSIKDINLNINDIECEDDSSIITNITEHYYTDIRNWQGYTVHTIETKVICKACGNEFLSKFDECPSCGENRFSK